MSGHVVLIGLSGSGKSAVGQRLAAMLARPLYDTDAMLAARAGMPVPALLRAGVARFRALEEEVVRDACGAPRGIIATGGGVVLSPRNRAMLMQGTCVLWLRAPAAVLATRLRDGEDRPLLAGDDPAAGLAALAAERDALYAACAHTVVENGALSLEETVRRVYSLALDWQAAHVR